jgi:hypothetical protein
MGISTPPQPHPRWPTRAQELGVVFLLDSAGQVDADSAIARWWREDHDEQARSAA